MTDRIDKEVVHECRHGEDGEDDEMPVINISNGEATLCCSFLAQRKCTVHYRYRPSLDERSLQDNPFICKAVFD